MSHALRLHDGTGEIAVAAGVGILLAHGRTVPTGPGYAPSCIFIRTDGNSNVTRQYVNVGTVTVANFQPEDIAVDKIVNVTDPTVTLSAATHANKTTTLNRAAGVTVTMPAATGTGNIYRLFVGTTTTPNIIINRAGSDTFHGMVYQLADGGSTLNAYECAGAVAITLNGTTTGGIKGDQFEFQDVASGTWRIIGHTSATGTEATPVS